MIVMKFGGTSVGSPEMIKRAAEIVKSHASRKPVVVVSAFAKVTDSLMNLAHAALNNSHDTGGIRKRHYDIMEGLGIDKSLISHELEELEALIKGISLLKELTPRTLDLLMSFGERMSAKIVAEYFSKSGLNARACNSYDTGFVTDSNFGNADVLPETEANIRDFFRNSTGFVPVVTGFIAKNANGEVTTLGRGGSDYTASIIGAAISAEEIQIWTDADGIMTADPKIVKNARSIDFISYEEAAELAFLGARVLHPKTILPAIEKNIPVRTLNTYNPGHKGTTILRETGKSHCITSIACKKGIKVINIHSPKMLFAAGFMHKIFRIFDELKISVDMVSTSEVNVSVTIDGKYGTEKLVKELENMADVDVRNNRASISVVGTNIDSTSGIAGKIFSSLGNKNINVEMISSGASKINESFVVKEEDADDAVRTIHETFFGEQIE